MCAEGPGVRANRGLLDGSVEAVARVSEAGHDVADLVESFVEGTENDRDIPPRRGLLDRGETLWRADQADGRDVDGAAREQVVDRCNERTTGGEHRVEHEALPV